MKILITNAYLDIYAGTQVVVRDLALELLRQGHQPLVYSPRLGQVAAELTNAGVSVTDRLDTTTFVPDIIHGQHYLVIEALLRFPSTPAIYVCHSNIGWRDEMIGYFPRILRYVAVDDLCRRRIESVPEIPRARIQVVANAVDLQRYQPRGRLPAKPGRALVFSNHANKSTYLGAVRKACRQAGLKLDVIGLFSGNATSSPESLLPQYDIVFAKARCALEALAVGNAVVLCDRMGLGPMVSTRNFDTLRSLNFGHSQLVNPIRAGLIRAEIERYNPEDAAAVSQRVREDAGLVALARQWIEIYTAAIEEFRCSPRNIDDEFRALANYWTRHNYATRVQWEMEQLGRLHNVPLVGGALVYFARRILRKWFGVYGVP